MHPEHELAELMGRYYADPLGFVMFAYNWGTTPELSAVPLPEKYRLVYDSKYGPDEWSGDFLFELGEKVKDHNFNGRDAVAPIREAIASGHGIGKSALVAWLVDWIMSTRPHSHGTVTANTAEQLSSKTWAEIAKWTSRCITGHWFDVTTGKGSMRMVHKHYPTSWFCTAQTSREENSESFAGQHAATSTSFYIFDEDSAIPAIIHKVAEGGLTDGEPMMFRFGNPTQNSGDFYDCFHGQRHRWSCRQIDSRSVAITNKKQIDEWIEDYGIDSDFVKIRVRGMFPSMSEKQFINKEDIDAGYGRHLRTEQYSFAPKILTCDPAWEGDDELVIGMRQGLRFDVLRVIAKNDNDLEIANILARLEDEMGADAVFIDAGYGTGVYSAGTTVGREWQLVWFGGASTDPGCLNKRAQMWKEMRDWLKAGGAYPSDEIMHDELMAAQTTPRADGIIHLEAKKDAKRRGLRSPNRADALALSFAYPVMKRAGQRILPEHENAASSASTRGHNPYEMMR